MPRLLLIVTLMAGTAAATLHGYSLSSYRWPTATVLYYVNPASIYVSPSAVTSAIQTAANVWNEQSTARIDLVYAGVTTGTALKLNYKNEVFLRNTTYNGLAARTYTYWDSKGKRIDSDIIFYEGSFRYFTNSGCSSKGLYVESIAAHEFGHLLGLQHSSVSTATMKATFPSYCDRTWLTLDADDKNGLLKAYP